MEKNIGFLIRKIQMEKQIPLKKVCYGVCSQEYIRNIKEYQMVDSELIVCLLTRLGFSPRKIEFFCTEKLYELYSKRIEIEDAVENELYEVAEILLEQYAIDIKPSQVLHMQYMYKMKAAVMYKRDRDYVGAINLINKAIRMTIPLFTVKDISQFLLSDEEWQLVFFLFELRSLNRELCFHDFELVLNNFLQRNMDNDISCSLFPKAIWIYIHFFQNRVNAKIGMKYIEQVILLLNENSMFSFLTLFVQKEIEYARRVNDLDKYSYYKLRKKALYSVLEKEKVEYLELKEIHTWKRVWGRNIRLFSELIRQERINQHITEETLAMLAGIDEKTISRIECGKNYPKNRTTEKIMKCLELDHCNYELMLDTTNYEILEYAEKIERDILKKRYEDAQNLLDLVERKVKKSAINEQFIISVELILDFSLHKIGANEALKGLSDAMRMTKKFMLSEAGAELKNVVLSKREVMIVKNVIDVLFSTGSFSLGMTILDNVICGIFQSKISMKFYFERYKGLIQDFLDNINWYKGNKVLMEKRKKLMQSKAIFDDSGLLVEGLIQNRIRNKKSYCDEEWFIYIYLLCQLFGNHSKMEEIRRWYILEYHKDIDVYRPNHIYNE